MRRLERSVPCAFSWLGVVLGLLVADPVRAEPRSPIPPFNQAVKRVLQALRDQRYAQAVSFLDEAWRLHHDERLLCKYGKAYLGLGRGQDAQRVLSDCLDHLKREEPEALTAEVSRELESDLRQAQQLLTAMKSTMEPAPAPLLPAPPQPKSAEATPAASVAPGPSGASLPEPALAPIVPPPALLPLPVARAESSTDAAAGVRQARRRGRLGWGLGLSLTTMLGGAAAGLGAVAYQGQRALEASSPPAYDDYRARSQTIRSYAMGADVAIGAALLTFALTVAIVPHLSREPEAKRAATAAAD